MTAFTIPACNLRRLDEELTKLNKIATKLGCDPVTYAVLARRVETISNTEEGGMETSTQRELADIEVSGTAPKLAGWEFIGRIEVEPASGLTFFYSAPGKAIPQAHRDAPHHCDHCGTVRTRRNTYIVANEAGSKRVGSDCLKDFLGHKSPDAIARLLEMIRDFVGRVESEYSTGGWSDPMMKLDVLIPQLAAIIRVKGWVTKTMADKAYTNGWAVPHTSVGNLQDILNPYRTAGLRDPHERKRIAQLIEDCKVTEADDVTGKVMEFIAARPDDGTDFTFNLKQLLKIQAAPVKTWGLLAAAVGMWFKEQGRLAERAARVSEYVPGVEVGQRIELELTLSKLIVIPGDQYGDRFLHSFRDAGGRTVIWFSTAGRIANEGETVKVKATVKALEEYKGMKQTVLTRAKKLSEQGRSEQGRTNAFGQRLMPDRTEGEAEAYDADSQTGRSP